MYNKRMTNSSTQVRPVIPPDIKKEVRRRCGYGCIFCGYPIYQIDHIIDWSVVHEHKAENLTLLCGNHHQQKTNGMIAHDAVVGQNNHPYALTHPESLAAIWYFGAEMPVFEIADNTFTYESEQAFYTPAVISGASPLKFYIEDGHMLLDFVAHDAEENEIIRIERNEMLLLPGVNDIEVVGSNVIIRQAPNSILLNITIKTAVNKVTLKRARISVGKNHLTITPSKFRLDNAHMRNFSFTGCQFSSIPAIAIDSPGVSAALVANLPRPQSG
jgi:hypothetical protein